MNRFQRAASLLPLIPYPYVGTEEPCNLCGSTEWRTVCDYDRRWKPLHSVVCTGCGLIRTNPMPTAEEVASYYATDYRRDYQFVNKGPPQYHVVRRGREAKARLDYLGPIIRPGLRVLDVGSGSGEFLAAARAKGCDVMGIEPGESYSAYSQTKYDLQVKTVLWSEAGFADESFDLITCWHVLEHMREPVYALRQMTAWLVPGGHLHIGVPNMMAHRGPSFERFHFAHLYGFIPETLVRAAQACGLEVDSRFLPKGTNIIFQKTGEAKQLPPNPAIADKVVAMYPPSGIAKFVLGGEWLRRVAGRLSRDLRDTRAKP